ncbi:MULTISPECIES: DUF2235 domain-containing protein [unclassified Bradyrhizobium]|uniref:T6SS phospholipase effector Tle1-like catalytic domain-containing protein n=1 Tax=unclassified Bradyrhizobium TaxID=2631580 RepID=UPI001CD7DEC1|nr:MULTISPECIES: DUF2235 domain-containing protein [unclassified Bradyrhizobium]MCA1386070.1 DUF2235 domain-containing protein [Bradyrhizobium sp. BRP05]MCA1393868.1 DUF2235 domain-containing protein [Bradyrhizobium sp. IC3123]MCA1423512.1 DUF2235 domain-containing protein [Bradyrhizobium sp. BRP23]MCA1430594.1 DUF2235 domain-containing protein [Bradyrhizobium sp. NBAIM16]MCA1480105.1 DUF2235 domain-containing protein [Bradyrhizobium sp. NBAIM08]
MARTLARGPHRNPARQHHQTELAIYAKHAISIDENRADFRSFPWSPTAEKAGERDVHGNLYFEQVCFPGVHADIGGGYLENEAACRMWP